MFVNCSNHPSERWGERQLQEAGKWGEITDYPFPYVKAEADEESVSEMARQAVRDIMRMNPDAVMCQGEFTLTYQIVQSLKEQGVLAVSACSERCVVEKLLSDGSTHRESKFHFIRFREY